MSTNCADTASSALAPFAHATRPAFFHAPSDPAGRAHTSWNAAPSASRSSANVFHCFSSGPWPLPMPGPLAAAGLGFFVLTDAPKPAMRSGAHAAARALPTDGAKPAAQPMMQSAVKA